MERELQVVVEVVEEVLPDDLKGAFREALNERICKYPYRDLRLHWVPLQDWLFSHVKPESSNPTSIKVYARWVGVTEKEMKRRMIENGD